MVVSIEADILLLREQLLWSAEVRQLLGALEAGETDAIARAGVAALAILPPGQVTLRYRAAIRRVLLAAGVPGGDPPAP